MSDDKNKPKSRIEQLGLRTTGKPAPKKAKNVLKSVEKGKRVRTSLYLDTSLIDEVFGMLREINKQRILSDKDPMGKADLLEETLNAGIKALKKKYKLKKEE